jgi:hypothetical protein
MKLLTIVVVVVVLLLSKYEMELGNVGDKRGLFIYLVHSFR